MAYKTLLFGTKEAHKKLKLLYDAEIERGNLEIVAIAFFENGKVNFVTGKVDTGGGLFKC